MAVDDAIGNSLPMDIDFRPVLTTHTFPITIIQGDSDYLAPEAHAWQTFAKTAPQVQVQVLAKSSHYAWIDAPAQFSAALHNGLSRTH